MNKIGPEKSEIDITFFVPCLNEERNIIGAIENIIAAVKEFTFSYEIIIIDDCSTDNTVQIIENYIARHPDIPIIFKKNNKTLGLGRNFINGAFLGKGKYYKIVAGKNDEPKESIVRLLQRLGDADIILPYFIHNDPRGLSRKILSRLFTKIVNIISGYNLKYYNSSAIHLRSNVVRWCPHSSGNGFHAELLVLLLNAKKTYIEVPIKIVAYRNRSTKVFTVKNALSVLYSLCNIFTYRLKKSPPIIKETKHNV